MNFGVEGHGKLIEPPSRSSLWRFQEFDIFEPNINYDDNQLYCGSHSVQYGENHGKCGVCGDAYNLPRPRDNEHGGEFWFRNL